MTITLRNLPPGVEEAIRETSRNGGISLNKATIRLLEASLSKSPLERSAKNTDFDEFCGVWSKAEADQFDAALLQMRTLASADWEVLG